MRSDNAKIGHTYLLWDTFLNKRKRTKLLIVSRILLAYLIEPKMIDKIDKLQMPWQQFRYQIHTPFLQSLRQNSMISIRKRIINNFPSFLLLQMLLIHKYSQQFHNSKSRMGIIELHTCLFRKISPFELSTRLFCMCFVSS